MNDNCAVSARAGMIDGTSGYIVFGVVFVISLIFYRRFFDVLYVLV